MKPILTRGGPNIELNALFIQPTRYCGLDCDGCYVKEHQGGEDSTHTDWFQQWNLFKKFYKGDHWANQITLAIDDLHKTEKKRDHQLLIADAIGETIEGDRRQRSDRPEVHWTAHTYKTILQYKEKRVRGWENLDMISLSEMSLSSEAHELYEWFRWNEVKINFNHMVPDRFNPDDERAYLYQRLRLVDMAYLVMKKSPVGRQRDLLTRIGDQGSMSGALLYKREVIDKLPDDARRKCHLDGCLSDTINHSTTGYGCSSNISRVQVWPDGSVSGCPYAFTGNSDIGSTAEAIIQNIRQALGRYDFKERCHLPQDYDALQRR